MLIDSFVKIHVVLLLKVQMDCRQVEPLEPARHVSAGQDKDQSLALRPMKIGTS